MAVWSKNGKTTLLQYFKKIGCYPIISVAIKIKNICSKFSLLITSIQTNKKECKMLIAFFELEKHGF
jgi:hypothetical protein